MRTILRIKLCAGLDRRESALSGSPAYVKWVVEESDKGVPRSSPQRSLLVALIDPFAAQMQIQKWHPMEEGQVGMLCCISVRCIFTRLRCLTFVADINILQKMLMIICDNLGS